MRYGNFIQVYSGGMFFPLDPRSEEIDILDIAHSLSFQNRFTGHTRFPYSVAQHSVLVADKCPRPFKLWGLIHDAGESYLVDLPSPIKRAPGMQCYRDAEKKILQAVAKRFDLSPVTIPEVVKEIDRRMCKTEALALMAPLVDGWDCAVPYDDVIIDRWDPEDAEECFLDTFSDLCAQRQSEIEETLNVW